MKTDSTPPRPASEAEARNLAESEGAAWIARRDAGLSAPEEQKFNAWLAAAPRNGEIWRALESTWNAFDAPRRAGRADGMVRELRIRSRRRTWRRAVGGATMAVAVTVAWIILAGRGGISETPTLAGGAVFVAPESQSLPDHSIVTLNKESAIDVAYAPAERRVLLLKGEANFAVSKNPARPFIVVVRGVELRAVGTAFCVKIGDDNVELVVSEGTVAIDRAGAHGEVGAGGDRGGAAVPSPVFVPAGGSVHVPTSAGSPATSLEIRTLRQAELDRRLEWLVPRLELSGTPLAEVVEMLNQRAKAHLSIADQELGSMRMSGVIRADNAEGFLRLLESGYGVRVERTAAGEIALHAARH